MQGPAEHGDIVHVVELARQNGCLFSERKQPTLPLEADDDLPVGCANPGRRQGRDEIERTGVNYRDAAPLVRAGYDETRE